MKSLITFITGSRATGEKLAEPKKFPIRTVTVAECNQWASEFKVGSRYGHRGSFYENKSHITVAYNEIM
jgi:hypothetical protein